MPHLFRSGKIGPNNRNKTSAATTCHIAMAVHRDSLSPQRGEGWGEG